MERPVMCRDVKGAGAGVCKDAETMRLKSLVKSELGGQTPVLLGGLLVER